MPEEKEELWEISVAMKGVLLRTIVTRSSLKGESAFEYIIREKGFNLSDLRSVEIRSM